MKHTTPESVRGQVADIKRIMGDFERAHSHEDSLYLEVLTHIARRDDVPPDVKEMAQEAIKTQELDFARHCA